MITHHCDVCAKASESMTAEANGMRGVPWGWFHRAGRLPGGNEIRVTCCSTECCAAYDKVEAEQVGFAWGKFFPPTDDKQPNPTLSLKPLTVK